MTKYPSFLRHRQRERHLGKRAATEEVPERAAALETLIALRVWGNPRQGKRTLRKGIGSSRSQVCCWDVTNEAGLATKLGRRAVKTMGATNRWSISLRPVLEGPEEIFASSNLQLSSNVEHQDRKCAFAFTWRELLSEIVDVKFYLLVDRM